MSYRTHLSAAASVFAVALAALVTFAPSTAKADPIAACGGIDFSGATGLSCNIQTSAGCTANCQPLNCTVSASAMCTATGSASCTGGCSGSCMANCSANPGSFSCSGDCSATCMGSCSSQCSSSSDMTTCMTQCQGSCTDQCNVSCNATPPMASCAAQCQASCGGSCQVDANVSCQTSASASCTGGCNTACGAEGALFCDFGNGLGEQYIDIDVTQVPGCISALSSMLNISVSGSLDVTGGVTGGSTGGGCAVSTSPGSPLPGGLLVLGFGLVGATVVRRRRQG